MLDVSNYDLPDLKQFGNSEIYYEYGECNRYIRVNQILRKKIGESRDLLALIYYCRKYDFYYFKFKTIQTVNQIDCGDKIERKIKECE